MYLYYKNLSWLWGADWNFCHGGNCSASRGLIGGFFNSHRTTIIDSFSCILCLRQLHLGLNMYYFIHFMQNCLVRFLSKMLTLKRLAENDVNMTSTSKRHNRRPDIMRESRLTGYSPLNTHEHSPRLFWGDYWLYIRAMLTSAVNHHDSYIGFCCVYLRDEFMSVQIKYTSVGNPVTG